MGRADVATLSTHVLDGQSGGGWAGVTVEVRDATGSLLASSRTDDTGRVTDLAGALPLGQVNVTWRVDGAFMRAVTASVALSEERHYHVPLLFSGSSATVYLGA